MNVPGGDSSVLRRLNTAAVLRGLRDGGEPTLTELAARAGLSRPTTEDVLADLAGRGLVTAAAARQGRGRPARRYRFHAAAGHALGVGIGAAHVGVFVADLAGEAAARHHAVLGHGWPPAERLAAVRTAVRAALAKAGVERSALWAAGAGTPGVVTADGRVARCEVLPGWAGVELGRVLGRALGRPVLVDNDANLAALAERWAGAARGADDVLYVLAGEHTGMGVVAGGRLHRGRSGAAGEVGVRPGLGLSGPADDDAMVHGIAGAALALDPEVVVVAGAGDRLMETLRRRVRPLCVTPVRIEAAELGADAVGLGALRLALDHVERDLFRV
ncbi:ROK family transcriptional regulator [Actinomadura macrotermitis]|uniref:N-acetyl-D-glucosamine kinase n=1 Tax=Actinomadura macrotermitis TaxID=2585200 RepID=A0A7K0C4J8_9ACTN|nr:ROK family transcriptional regulator [Actinomadura macrotermitis]MQY08042.1 N-acetyl-D-glucosamine kinase [Actinomadura macrotermitis]